MLTMKPERSFVRIAVLPIEAPVPVMKLVEIVVGLDTAEEVVESCWMLASM